MSCQLSALSYQVKRRGAKNNGKDEMDPCRLWVE
jgi:hypothetical protein